MVRFCCVALLLLLSIANCLGQTGFTVDNLLQVRRVADPQLAPNGKWVAFTIGDVNVDANRVNNQIYLVPVGGGEVKQLTSGAASNSAPRWSPDGSLLAFVTGGQIWTIDVASGVRKQITTISSGAGQPVWSPNGKLIAFLSDVYPDCADDPCNAARDQDAEKSKVQARVTDRLLYRHWVEWRNLKRTHVFVIAIGGGRPVDLTPGDFDAPPYAAATGLDMAFSPDSNELCYLRNPDKVEATSTNSDLFSVPVTGGPATDITVTNKGYDVGPVYSADGKYIVYRSQATAGFEADRWRLMAYDRHARTSRELLTGFDLQVEEAVVSADSSKIYFTAGMRGQLPIFSVPIGGGSASKIADGYNTNIALTADSKTIVHAMSTLAGPTEIHQVGADGTGMMALSHANDSAFAGYALKKAESMEWTGALNTKIHGFLVKPANFDPSKKYPLIVLIHGGPQSAFNDSWGYRWNPQVFAGAGYVVFYPNPRGSTGYGQKFVNDISADWGGKAYIDLINGVAEVAKLPYIDKSRIGAAGASYGGYMVDWILGHNTDPRVHFKTLVSHAGVYNLESMAGATEELWFTNWEFKGQPWTNPVMYAKWSPHKFAANFKTPTLVTCGELDYRVPYDQSLQLYTALQLNGTESKLIVFPDEGHWILKPQNSKFWYTNVQAWLAKYLTP